MMAVLAARYYVEFETLVSLRWRHPKSSSEKQKSAMCQINKTPVAGTVWSNKIYSLYACGCVNPRKTPGHSSHQHLIATSSQDCNIGVIQSRLTSSMGRKSDVVWRSMACAAASDARRPVTTCFFDTLNYAQS
jgi:hypothetical protein